MVIDFEKINNINYIPQIHQGIEPWMTIYNLSNNISSITFVIVFK